MTNLQLPPKTAATPAAERQYRTALKPAYYLRLEKEALERGITPYRFTQIIMTMYLDGRFINKDNPAENTLDNAAPQS
ncbi:MAG: hypothetical protein ACU837_10680 [Gammaproteobacteria bacterium]